MRILLLVLLLLASCVYGGEPAPHDVLTRLMEGNRRFVAGKTQHPHSNLDWRKRLSSEQHPVATVFGCADSRVPLELIFDQGFGDLFVVRQAGEVVNMDTIGNIEYGVFHLHTRLVLVVGHEGCGAVTAALGDYRKEPFPIQDMLKKIVPALEAVRSLPKDQQVDAGVRSNVLQTVRELSSISQYKQLIEQGKLLIRGGVYDLDNGAVTLL